MKKSGKKQTGLQVASALSALCLIAWSGPSFAQSQRSQQPANSYVSSQEIRSSDQIDFDGKGTIDVITPVATSTAKDAKISLALATMIINGQQLQCADEVQIFDQKSQPLPVDLLQVGDYVGFQKDPADKIFKLWKVTPQTVVSAVSPEQKQAEKQAAPRNETPIQFVDGVWKN